MSNQEPEVLDNTSINAKVDFSLSKDDLTDMVLEEKFEALEDQLEIFQKQYDELNTQMGVLTNEYNEQLLAKAKKGFDKKIKAAEKFFGKEAVVELSSNRATKISKHRTLRYISFEKRHGSSRRRKVEQHEQIEGCKVNAAVKATILAGKDPDKYRSDADNLGPVSESGSWKISRRFSDEEVMKMPAIKKMLKLDEQRLNVKEQIILYKSELANLETSGKRARAKMVKALLGASEQGRALLGKMPRMNHNLLTE